MRLCPRVIMIACVALALGLLAPTIAAADGEGEIKYRQKVMSAVGAHTGALVSILKQEGGSMDHLADHADAMAKLAEIARTAFPAGSGPEAGKTGALADIWDGDQHSLEFEAELEKFVQLANALADVAVTGDRRATGGALKTLGQDSCKSCHSKFRKK